MYELQLVTCCVGHVVLVNNPSVSSSHLIFDIARANQVKILKNANKCVKQVVSEKCCGPALIIVVIDKASYRFFSLCGREVEWGGCVVKLVAAKVIINICFSLYNLFSYIIIFVIKKINP